MAIDHVACYRQRAVDMRKLAARAQSEHLRYLNIAQDWDRLAEEAEQGEERLAAGQRNGPVDHFEVHSDSVWTTPRA